MSILKGLEKISVLNVLSELCVLRERERERERERLSLP